MSSWLCGHDPIEPDWCLLCRIKELEAEVERLRERYESAPCSCIPGNKCQRCAALREEA